MVFRKPHFQFAHRRVRTKILRKLIINDLPKTPNDAVYPKLPFMIREKAAKVKNPLENDLKGQLFGLTFSVSNLIRDERVVLNYFKGTEVRSHVERLIIEAMRHGDRHRPTMALADYWLREKNLVHKLFKVLVPRYLNYTTSFTAIHYLGKDLELAKMSHEDRVESRKSLASRGQVVLELRGNNLPPIIRPQSAKPFLLTNVLLEAARHETSRTRSLGSNAATNANEVD